MVATGQHRYLATARVDQSIAAMLTDIVKRANHAVATRHHEDTLFENLLRHKASGFAHLADMRHQVPGFEKDLGLLLLEHLGVVEETCRQGVAGLLILSAPTRLF